jgi:hypothetical protein
MPWLNRLAWLSVTAFFWRSPKPAGFLSFSGGVYFLAEKNIGLQCRLGDPARLGFALPPSWC